MVKKMEKEKNMTLMEYQNLMENIKIKNYYNFNLIFDGEYKNDEKYKGKFYKNNESEFEGEFKNGEKWTGKRYDKDGNIVYQLINGYGNIKEFDVDGDLIFEREYSNGKRNGKGKEYDFFGNMKYEGEYLNGL